MSCGNDHSSSTGPLRRAMARYGYGSSTPPSWMVSGSSNGSNPGASAPVVLVISARLRDGHGPAGGGTPPSPVRNLGRRRRRATVVLEVPQTLLPGQAAGEPHLRPGAVGVGYPLGDEIPDRRLHTGKYPGEIRGCQGGFWVTIEPLTPERRRAMTRQHLLEAAAIVFARKGFHESTLDEVAATAGFSKGAVYSNFKSKDDLFVE